VDLILVIVTVVVFFTQFNNDLPWVLFLYLLHLFLKFQDQDYDHHVLAVTFITSITLILF